MAFFRVERKKSGSYIRLVETFRQEGKVKHRIIASLGKPEDYSEQTLKRLGEKLYLPGGGDLQDLVAKDFSEEKRLNYDFVQAVDKGLRHFGLAPILYRIAVQKKNFLLPLRCRPPLTMRTAIHTLFQTPILPPTRRLFRT